MANIKLHSDSPVSATSVSNTFIDEYMSDANGEFVKILPLYLLRLYECTAGVFFHFFHRGQVRAHGEGMSSVPFASLGAHASVAA